MTIITGTWTCTDSLDNLKTGKYSKEWLKKWNKTFSTEQSMRLPTKSVVLGNS